MIEREPLPTPAQLNAITDLAALEGLKDEVEQRIVKMETDLEFVSGDPDWASRARAALARHRYVDRLIVRRMNAVRLQVPKGATAERPASDCHALTLEVLATRPVINPTELTTTQEVDQKIEWLRARIEATTADREDEIGMTGCDRDEAFLAATGNALRQMRGQRMDLQTRRGEITRAERALAHAAREVTREQLFIDAAREVLDRNTYMRIWDRVDAMETGDQARAVGHG